MVRIQRSNKLGVCVMMVVLELYPIKEIEEDGEFVILNPYGGCEMP